MTLCFQILIYMFGCSADLLVGELAIPGEVPVDLVSSADILGFGSDVAIDNISNQIVAAADESGWAGWPGADEIILLSASSMNVWFDSGRPMLGAGGFGVLDIGSGELLHEFLMARTVRGFDGGWIAASADRVVDSDGGEWIIEDPRVVAASDSLRVAISCEDLDCIAVELVEDGTIIELGIAGDSGDIWIEGTTVWWGSPDINTDGAQGRVDSSMGDVLIGAPGDHLGRSIGGGYTVGGINWELSPRRTIIRSLGGFESVSLDGVSGPGTIALAGNENNLVLGVPGWSRDGVSGAVISIERDNIE